MRKLNYILAVLGLVTLWSCKSEDPVLPDAPAGEGRTAYITVNLRDVNSGTRATGDYAYGTTDEQTIENVNFYFFDENGYFVSSASLKNDDTPVAPGDSFNNNISYEKDQVVVLKNLTGTDNPKYMLTVVNAPSDFKPESTMVATSQALLDWKFTNTASQRRWVMSTSSYVGDTNNHTNNNHAYCVNTLNDNNFIVGDPGDSTVTPEKPKETVVVYVERLAAKIQVDINATEDSKNPGYYKLKATVAGENNNQDGTQQGATELYVKVDGWGLSTTAKNSYISKQLADAWITDSDNQPYNGWNEPGDFRSFWAKSSVYDVTFDQREANFNYKTFNSLQYAMLSAEPTKEKYAYCNENTMPKEGYFKVKDDKTVANAPIGSLATSVLIKTHLYMKDEDGNMIPADLVRHHNVLYKRPAFLQYVLSNIDQGANNLNIWYVVGNIATEDIKTNVTLADGSTGTVITWNSNTKFQQIDADYVKLDQPENASTGSVTVVANSDKFTGSFYKRTKDVDGKLVMVQIGSDETSAQLAFDTLKKQLEDIMKTLKYGEAFNEGAMYYTIPIEHNSSLMKTPEGATEAVKDYTAEGFYGVVRNHWYQLNISSIVNVGHGIFKPGNEETGEGGELIIPDTPEDPRYFVQAELKVLSWRIVSQDVPL